MLDYAFGVLRLPCVAYAVDAANQRSERLMRRLGFTELPNLHPAAGGSLGVLENDRPRRDTIACARLMHSMASLSTQPAERPPP